MEQNCNPSPCKTPLLHHHIMIAQYEKQVYNNKIEILNRRFLSEDVFCDSVLLSSMLEWLLFSAFNAFIISIMANWGSKRYFLFSEEKTIFIHLATEKYFFSDFHTAALWFLALPCGYKLPTYYTNKMTGQNPQHIKVQNVENNRKLDLSSVSLLPQRP